MDTKIVEVMIDRGWHISDEGYQIISNNGSTDDVRVLIQNALDSDFKDIGKSSLPADLTKAIIKNVILQIQKVKNISAPKSNQDSQAAPRMIKLILTDGEKYFEAIEVSSIPSLSYSNTPLGTKLLIKNATFESGYLLLDSSSCQFLGGKVASLYEKWELNKSFAKQRTRYNGEGPPPWVNFGQKIISAAELSNIKSTDEKDKNKEMSEFDVQRKDAIAWVASGATKKVFGGGIKQQNLMGQQKYNNEQKKNYPVRQDRKITKKEPNIEEKLQKPSEKISLFDFLETKLPNSEDNITLSESNALAQYQNTAYNSSYNSSRNNVTNSYSCNTKYSDGNNRYQNQRNKYTNPSEHKSITRYNKQENNYTNTFSNPNTSVYNKDNQNSYKQDQVHHKTNTPSSDQNLQKLNTSDKTVSTLSNSFAKMSVNSEFASRSLRQHLNLQPSEHRPRLTWKKGDHCMAKYWEDNKHYIATITAVTNRTCVVQFNDYGNIEEVLQSDCIPLSSNDNQKDQGQMAPVEFRRGNRVYKPNRTNFKSNF